ncbi:hypothetical protein EV356DRAFT_534989 [Viridothelium virens]|uniref:ABM domain-containing protein n=1 Tax=Viridothelium virens TaxID=1048519 RepID=A0A6A6H291_VIRVR|nr:hypothetical protein EV356DRAFT_534989 [Viridothelium virens]
MSSTTETSKVELIAVVTIKPDKVERVKALTTTFIDFVKAQEPDTLNFYMVEEVDATEPRFIMVESYKDQASMEAHSASSNLKTLFATFEEEKVFMSAPQQYVGKKVAGFTR